MATAAVAPAFEDLIQSLPQLHDNGKKLKSVDFDWALHPGGSTIITGVEKAMGLTSEHLRATYEVYMNYGNSSSATIMSVMNRLRESDGRENVIACAFGPGISLEIMALKRRNKCLDNLPQEDVD